MEAALMMIALIPILDVDHMFEVDTAQRTSVQLALIQTIVMLHVVIVIHHLYRRPLSNQPMNQPPKNTKIHAMIPTITVPPM
jgi:hypothetical protein